MDSLTAGESMLPNVKGLQSDDHIDAEHDKVVDSDEETSIQLEPRVCHLHKAAIIVDDVVDAECNASVVHNVCLHKQTDSINTSTSTHASLKNFSVDETSHVNVFTCSNDARQKLASHTCNPTNTYQHGGNVNLVVKPRVRDLSALPGTSSTSALVIKDCQPELQLRLQELSEKLMRMEMALNKNASQETTSQETSRLVQIESQLADFTQQRLSQLEKMQRQQLRLQAQLLQVAQQSQQNNEVVTTRPKSPFFNERSTRKMSQKSSASSEFVSPSPHRKRLRAGTLRVGGQASSEKSFLRDLLHDSAAGSSRIPVSIQPTLKSAPRQVADERKQVQGGVEGLLGEISNLRKEVRDQIERIRADDHASALRSSGSKHLEVSLNQLPADRAADHVSTLRSREQQQLYARPDRFSSTRTEDRTPNHILSGEKQLLSFPLDRLASASDSALSRQQKTTVPKSSSTAKNNFPLDRFLAKHTQPLIQNQQSALLERQSAIFSDGPGLEVMSASEVLRRVTTECAILENNFETIERNREGQIIYSLIDDLLNNDEEAANRARLRAMVDDTIRDIAPPSNAAKTRPTYLNERLAVPKRTKLLPTAVRSLHNIRTAAVARVDSGLIGKENNVPLVNQQRHKLTYIPATVVNLNRRRSQKQPYLHFINEIKNTSKTPVSPQSLLSHKENTTSTTALNASSDVKKKAPNVFMMPTQEELLAPAICFGVRQFSRQPGGVVLQDNKPQVVVSEILPSTEKILPENTSIIEPLETSVDEANDDSASHSSCYPSEDGEGVRLLGSQRANKPARSRSKNTGEPRGAEAAPTKVFDSVLQYVHDPLEQRVRNRLEDEILANLLAGLSSGGNTDGNADRNHVEHDLSVRQIVEDALLDEIRRVFHESQSFAPAQVREPRTETRQARIATPQSTPPDTPRSMLQSASTKSSNKVHLQTPLDSRDEYTEDEFEEDFEPAYETSKSESTASVQASLPSRHSVLTPLQSQSHDAATRHDISTPDVSETATSVSDVAQGPPGQPPCATTDFGSQTMFPSDLQIQHSKTPSSASLSQHSNEHSSPVAMFSRSVTPSPPSSFSITAPGSLSEGVWLAERSEGQAPPVLVDSRFAAPINLFPTEETEMELTATEWSSAANDRSDGEWLQPKNAVDPRRIPMLHLLARPFGCPQEKNYSFSDEDVEDNSDYLPINNCSNLIDRSVGEVILPADKKVNWKNESKPSDTHFANRPSKVKIIEVHQSVDSIDRGLGFSEQMESDRQEVDLSHYLALGSTGGLGDTSMTVGSDTAGGTAMLDTQQIIADAFLDDLGFTGGSTYSAAAMSGTGGGGSGFGGMRQRVQVTMPSLDTLLSDEASVESNVSEINLSQ